MSRYDRWSTMKREREMAAKCVLTTTIYSILIDPKWIKWTLSEKWWKLHWQTSSNECSFFFILFSSFCLNEAFSNAFRPYFMRHRICNFIDISTRMHKHIQRNQCTALAYGSRNWLFHCQNVWKKITLVWFTISQMLNLLQPQPSFTCFYHLHQNSFQFFQWILK